MRALILRLDATMLSFGTVMVDQHGFINRFPGTAMLCGLIANALGWHHGDFSRLQDLQTRIRYAARWDFPPQRMVDYHTVDLSQPKMSEHGWTTRGVPEHRTGATDTKYGTHQRYRHYWIDGLMTVALQLTGESDPNLDTVKAAFQQPARPLFLGRKTCLPSRPLLDPELPFVEAENLVACLRRVPLWDRYGSTVPDTSSREACWPADLEGVDRGEMRRVYDLRDWANQLPAGSRWQTEGLLGGEQP